MSYRGHTEGPERCPKSQSQRGEGIQIQPGCTRAQVSPLLSNKTGRKKWELYLKNGGRTENRGCSTFPVVTPQGPFRGALRKSPGSPCTLVLEPLFWTPWTWLLTDLLDFATFLHKVIVTPLRKKKNYTRSSYCGSAETNLTSILENAGSIHGLSQWVKDLVLP